jgi:hypothetical protein
VRGTVVGCFTDGALSGVIAFGAPALAVRYRSLIASRAARDTVLAQAGGPSAPEHQGIGQNGMEGPSA